MSLPAGTRLGAYEIVSLLGVGGMGEVYRARDGRLHRDVAVKIIPQALSADPERLARFEREAQALAALSHPNIAHIYGFEEHAHTCAIVMELVEGSTIAQLIAAAPGGLPMAEAIVLARQMAEAVETAHEHGVIHRDFKPGNVMVGADDRVKVLDFGLARIADASWDIDVANSPTVASPVATRSGLILGTAAYMAPEQAKGRVADKRSDVWSFGCVLYEMLTGMAAFNGENVADMLASVLTREPDWSRLPSATPRAVRLCVQRCLIRDRHDRIADMSTVRFLLTDAGLETSAEAQATAVPVTPLRGGARRWAWVGATVVLVAAAAGAGWLLRPSSLKAPSPTGRFEVTLPEGEAAFGRSIAISSDGSTLALAGSRQLFVRPLASMEALPIPGGDDDPTFPVFAPNGQSILYVNRTRPTLSRIGLAGGRPERLAELPDFPDDIAWDGDTILVALNNEAAGIFALPARGGSLRQIVKTDPTAVRVSQPEFVSGTHVLYTERRVQIPVAMGGNSLMIAPLDGSDRPSVVQKNASSGHLLPSGHLAYIGDGALRVAPFDGRTHTVTGDSTVVVPALGPSFSVSHNGTLVHGAPTFASSRLLVWIDRAGHEQPITAKPGGYYDVRISPDEQHIALSLNRDIWIWSIAQGTLTNLTLTNDAVEYNPLWADSRFVVFDYADAGSKRILKRAWDGTGPAIELAKEAGYPEALSKDGRWLVYHKQTNVGMVLPLDPPGQPKPLVAGKYHGYNADLSPNGQWITYQSDESGQNEIYVRPFPSMDTGHWQISSDGGAHPLWARSGRELFYIDGAGMMTSVAVQTAGQFTYDKRTSLFPAGQYYFNVARNYDVTSDGRFVTTRTVAGPVSRPVFTVVMNWFDEVAAKLRAR